MEINLNLIYFHIIHIASLSFTVISEKPENVVLLLADDAAFEMGAYLNHYCLTPNLDEFAKQSLIFNNAFTTVSSCSPSRAQILTGLPSHQNGMYGLHHGYHHFNSFETINSLPNILHENNIFTGIIGKKHVGLNTTFQFDYEQTEENHPINQIGRNITLIKLYVRDFLNTVIKLNKERFFLIVAFHDPHRCGHITPEYGEFCELWGSGERNMGKIQDWQPIYYDWRNLPYQKNLPETDVVRKELAAQYQTISRLDQGIGLVLKELKSTTIKREKNELNILSSTLVIYTSDNGPPFPFGRTNLYDYGIREPIIIYSPEINVRRNSVTYAMTSLLDIFPTVLDVFEINTSKLSFNLTGHSLLPLLKQEPDHNDNDAIFGSQEFHEVTMNYPMRMIRTSRYKVIHNLNYQSYFPIDQDAYLSPTFQEILNASINNQSLPWYRSLEKYYSRSEWEMYDIKLDPLELHNLANKSKFKKIFAKLRNRLYDWQLETNDPWICAPHAVLQNQGVYKNNPVCLPLGHKNIFK